MTAEEKNKALDDMCLQFKEPCSMCPCINMNACTLPLNRITASDINEAYQAMKKFMRKQRQRT